MQKQNFDLSNRAEGCFIETNRFNSTYIAFHFFTPLSFETMAEDALLPYVLTSCSNEYRDFSQLNLTLLKLYGAELSCSVSKSGDYLHTRIGISVINNEFAYDNENVTLNAANLLLSLIFSPAVKDGSFYDNDLMREKRKTVERIKSEINNKRSYARTRLAEIIFSNEPYGKFIYGTEDEVNSITGEGLYRAYKRILSSAYIQVNVVGNKVPDGFFQSVSQKLSDFDRSNIPPALPSKPLHSVEQVNFECDRMDVTQGKLVMGFSSEVYGSFKQACVLAIFADIFGGGPYSRLFSNVRESKSLCYYCSASQRRSKALLIVDSGVDPTNADAAKQAILFELSEMQKGEVEDFRIEASKKAIIDSLMSNNDSAQALDLWHTSDITDTESVSIEEAILLVDKITKEDIVRVAKGIKLHSVYSIMPKEGNAQ